MGPESQERADAIAANAVQRIRALVQPADPPRYELWYRYFSGASPALNDVVDEILARTHTLSARDFERVYRERIPRARLIEKNDSVGAKVIDEVAQVGSMIEAALGTVRKQSERLSGAMARLRRSGDPQQLRGVADALIRCTKESRETNHALGLLLKASREEIRRLQQSLETARLESMTDLLTSLPTRECFDRTFAGMIAEAEANQQPVSLLLIDIDYFRKFNEVFGHLVGDEVLRVVAMAIRQNIKGKDFAARFGGEEFAVVLPDTALKSARVVAEQLRNAIVTKELKKVVTGESLGRLTISIGVAMARAGQSAAAVIERAETCLREAKQNGRNQTLCETRFGVAAEDPPVSRAAAG
jgi:diguanylate cyclase